jgi:hypothetical protein
MQANVPFEQASLQVNFNTIAHAEALRSLRLFASEVMPHFTAAPQVGSPASVARMSEATSGMAP